MSVNGSARLLNGKMAQKKTRGKAFINELHSIFDGEEKNAAEIELKKYDKRKK